MGKRPLAAMFVLAAIPWFVFEPAAGAQTISEKTQQCIECHSTATPSVVEDWKRSRHSRVTPGDALKKKPLERRVSNEQIPEQLLENVVGCAECHCRNVETHKDVFEHNDEKVHLTVTPGDCKTCHSVEADQYGHNIMSHAYGNLTNNKLYTQMVNTINGTQVVDDQLKITTAEPDDKTNADSCFSCHGTALHVTGKNMRDTSFGEMEFLTLSGWPNQGVGRLNPDGTRGLCHSCHSKHEFSISVARKPYTCSQCHKGPDVPAYQAYSVSKHGNLYFSNVNSWKMDSVPWSVGKDFAAPTCATCHVSLITSADGEVISQRSHQMSDRLPWRIFGLIYAHEHPKSPDTSIIVNKDGLPLPTTLRGDPASEFLIGKEEVEKRRSAMHTVCRSCHSQDWVQGHWSRFEQSLKTTNDMTRAATKILQTAWNEKLADPVNPFDEGIERLWVDQWLFYANSTRFASAMQGADYGVFANGRYYLSKNLRDLKDRFMLLKTSLAPGAKKRE